MPQGHDEDAQFVGGLMILILSMIEEELIVAFRGVLTALHFVKCL